MSRGKGASRFQLSLRNIIFWVIRWACLRNLCVFTRLLNLCVEQQSSSTFQNENDSFSRLTPKKFSVGSDLMCSIVDPFREKKSPPPPTLMTLNTFFYVKLTFKYTVIIWCCCEQYNFLQLNDPNIKKHLIFAVWRENILPIRTHIIHSNDAMNHRGRS